MKRLIDQYFYGHLSAQETTRAPTAKNKGSHVSICRGVTWNHGVNDREPTIQGGPSSPDQRS